MLGILDDARRFCQAAFREEGDILALLSAYDDPNGGLGGSEYLSLLHGVEAGIPPHVDLDGEKRLQELLIECIREGLFASCHDVSEGGLAVCLAESALLGGVGAAVLMNRADFAAELPASALLFGEAQGRVAISVRSEKDWKNIQSRAIEKGVRVAWIGTVGGEALRIALGSQILTEVPVSALAQVSRNAIPRRMSARVAVMAEA
jgi:phosphoribosylformylglycinamidine synthase